jgi:hypothetical protein
VNHVENAGDIVSGGSMDGPASVEVLGVPVSAVPVVHSSAGQHRGVIRHGGCLLADGTCIECVGAFAHQSVKRRGTRLAELLDGTWVEAVDGYRYHVINGIVSRLIDRSGGDDRLLARR